MNDVYFEQATLSAWSLRQHTPLAHIVLVTDQETEKELSPARKKLLDNFDEIVVVNVPMNYTQHQRSRYLKTTLRSHIVGDYLFVDSDTIVCDDLSALDSINVDIAMAIDKHMPLAMHPKREITDERLKKNFGFIRGINDEMFFNSGVILARETDITKRLYEEWYRIWRKGLHTGLSIDQPSLLIANHNTGHPIVELGGIWNCQFMDNGLRFFYNAKILHYFASNTSEQCFKFKEKAIFEEMSRNGEISDSTKNMVINAKCAFFEKMMIVAGKDADIFSTSLYHCYRYYPNIFKVINSSLDFIFNISKKIRPHLPY